MTNDIFAEEASLKRRRELLQAILGQSQAAPIVGDTGLGQGLAKLATAWIAGKRGGEIDQAESANKTAYGQQLAGELGKFSSTQQGMPGQTLDDAGAKSLMQGNVNPQLADPVKADPRKAVYEALASRFPEMKAVGAAGLKELLKKPESSLKEVNGQLVDTKSWQVVGDYRTKPEKWGEPYEGDIGGGRKGLLRRNETTGKVEAIGSQGPTVNVSTPEKTFLNGLAETALPGGKSYEPAKAAAQSLQIANEQVAAINQGAQSGSLGEIQQTLRKFSELVGVPQAATAPTEMLGNLAKQRVLAKLGGLGAQISNSDRDFLSSAQGDLNTNPEAFKRLLAISMAGDLMQLQRHGKVLGSLSGKIDDAVLQSGKIGFSAEISDPAISGMLDNILAGRPSVAGVPGANSNNTNPGVTPPAKPISLQEYLDNQIKR